MNILILTGRFGLGHIKCAEALRETILRENPDSSVFVVDLMEYLFPKTKKMIYGSFNLLVTRFSKVYNLLNKAAGKCGGVPLKDAFIDKFDTLIEDYQPDVVIANLPVCGQYYSAYCKDSGCKIPLYVYVTDITFHNEWAVPGTSQFFVGDVSTKNALISKGIDSEIIHITGIPVTDRLSGDLGKNARNTDSDDKTDNVCCTDEMTTANNLCDNMLSTQRRILVMGGGLGLVPGGTELLEALNNMEDAEVILVCGSNDKLMNLVISKYRNITAFGLTNMVPELMNRATVVITKPGGITTFEAIKSRTPLYIINPELEQEVGNAYFIEQHNIGRVVYDGVKLSSDINDFISNEELLKEMRRNMSKLSEEYESANPLNYLEACA